MTGEVCTRCECYLTPPSSFYKEGIVPKMCQCHKNSRTDLLLEEILREVKEIKRTMMTKRSSTLGPL